MGISLPIKARYQRAARAGFNKNERLRWTCLPETWPELVAAATNRGDDTKNVDDGRSSRAAEDVGHSLWLPLRALKSIFHRRTPGY